MLEDTTTTTAGGIVRPGDADYDQARLAWNLACDQRPAAIATPADPAGVATAIAYARENGLRVAVQSTGHGAGPLGDLSDSLLLKTSRMREVAIDPDRRIARAGGGAWWIDVTEPAGQHGLAALAGSSPDVGVAGYTLGGGLSWMARQHGFGANQVTAIELVTADGRHLRVDADNHPDLFWALRGGGGAFGVVTAIEMRLVLVREIYAGMLLYPIGRAAEVLKAWRELADELPDAVTSLGRLLWLPPIPEIPEPLRGRAFVGVEVAALLEHAEAEALVAPLRALDPEMDTLGVIPASGLGKLHMDPEHPVPGAGDGMLLADIDADGIDALLAATGTRDRYPLLSIEIRQLGGALSRSHPEHGAVGPWDAGFAMYGVGIVPVPQARPAVDEALEAVTHALAPWEADRSYTNFREVRVDGRHLFGAHAHDRLIQVKQTHDPEGLFRSNHPIGE